MATPPESLPSPTPSSSSHSHSHFQALQLQHPRASSTASGMSSAGHSHPHTPNHLANGDSPLGFELHHPYAHPHPQHLQHQHQHPTTSYSTGPPPFLPALSSSPPPHPPPYVPPPQHAMAPDPILAMESGPGMLPPGVGVGGPGGIRGWSNGAPWPNGSRAPGGGGGGGGAGAGSTTPGFGSSHSQQGYPRGGLPNGRHLPTNPDGYASRGSGGGFGAMGMGMGGMGPRPGSAAGEARDRRRERRDRERDDERELEEEVISTIFVVGFPDDMAEREFQNIFTFAQGFEAATLKFPSGSQRREPAAALLAELTHLAAHRDAQAAAAAASGAPPGEYPDYPLNQANLEEAMAAMSISMGTTASTSQSTTPSAAMSLTPSVPSGPMLGNPPGVNMPTRRQTIGFARFKTRADALAAKEQLQGKKIDSLTGATLKAEMAKKNLHTKRTTSGEELVGLLLRSGRLAGLVNAAGTGPQGQGQGSPVPGATPGSGGAPPSAREAWDAWSSANAGAGAQGQGERSAEDAKAMPPPPVPTSQAQGGSHQPQQSFSSSSTFVPPNPAGSASAPSASGAGAGAGASGNSSAQSNASNSPSLSVKSPAQRATDSKALLALAEEADELEGWNFGAPAGMGLMDGYAGAAPGSGVGVGVPAGPAVQRRALGSQSQQGGLGHAGYGLGMSAPGAGGGYGLRAGHEGYGTSPPGGSDHLSETGRPVVGANPADQNPPINTLYVGNLPAISPPTHPPNFLEESLRSLFGRCLGFKRMSFRQKINGPMCFVEFEEVVYAAQAIKELYGHNLGGLVKGGIRLSYSKNSLGQRGNAHPSALNTNMFGGIAHTVALAGMSLTSPTSGAPHLIPSAASAPGAGAVGANPANGPMSAGAGQGYGLQLQQGARRGSDRDGVREPATAPLADMRRESAVSAGGLSNGTSLSPTARPFNAPLPSLSSSASTNPTSPRSRYFQPQPIPGNPNKLSPTESAGSFSTSTGQQSGVPIPSAGSSANSSFHPFGQLGSSSNSTSASASFSPVSSPIRTPASFSWLSSSAGTGGGGLGGYGYEFGGSGVPLGSLNGAASAWGQSAERRE
ncbi:hypothetical protein IAT38_004917 [Cryptococcus sp. DSM 104549]